MRGLVRGGGIALLVAVTVLAARTPLGQAALRAEERLLTARVTGLYHAGWVAAAWPVENVLLVIAHQGYVPALVVPHTATHRTALTAPLGNDLIGWHAWEQPGVATRWRALHAATAQAARVRQLVTLELWLVPLLLLVGLARPLLALTAGLGRLQPGTGHGSAHLAGGRELRALRPRRGQSGLRLGRAGRRQLALPEREVYEHVLVCGPPGSGKSSGLILPNILAERGTRSLVIVDPKSELLGLTCGAVSRHSEVWTVNFLDPDTSCGYNPLAGITDYLAAESFAESWISNTGRSSKEPFWDNAAKQLIVAAVLHLCAETADSGVPPTLIDLARFFTRHDAETIAAVLGASRSEPARETAAGFLASMSKNDKLLGSVFSELPPRFSILQDARVQQTTSRHEIDFARLGHGEGRPIALYLALERTMAPLLKPLSACFFMQLFQALIRIADASPGGVLPRPVLGYLDEFGNIGAIPDMARWMSTVRSARIGFLLAVQDLAQLGAIYGREGRQIIVTDCSTKIALPKTSADDAEWFSRGTGTATVLTYSAGDSRTRGERLPRSGNRGVGETGRPLLTPGEVTRLPEDRMLVLSGNRQPLVVQQRRWYQERRLRRLGHLAPAMGRQAGPILLPRTAAPAPPDGSRTRVTPSGGGDDGAIQLDNALPAGEHTWVVTPEDRTPAAAAHVPAS